MAELVGSATEDPFGPAEAAAEGWLMAIGLPLFWLRMSNKPDGRLFPPETKTIIFGSINMYIFHGSKLQ